MLPSKSRPWLEPYSSSTLSLFVVVRDAIVIVPCSMRSFVVLSLSLSLSLTCTSQRDCITIISSRLYLSINQSQQHFVVSDHCTGVSIVVVVAAIRLYLVPPSRPSQLNTLNDASPCTQLFMILSKRSHDLRISRELAYEPRTRVVVPRVTCSQSVDDVPAARVSDSKMPSQRLRSKGERWEVVGGPCRCE